MSEPLPDHLGAYPLPTLPALSVPDPRSLLDPDPQPPRNGLRCGNPQCGWQVGAPFPGAPTRLTGYCRNCGTRYSLRPQLKVDEQLDNGRYRVLGCVAHGGLGWVYLAEDTRLKNRLIALKGVLNPHDPRARAAMLEERDRMIAVTHDSVVRILDYVTHPGEQPVDYIVMEFVGGRSLREVIAESGPGGRPFGPRGPALTLDHVALYGGQVLSALQALHDRGLVYSDMKPDNVIHHGSRVVLIDLGGVQRAGDTARPPVITHGYASPEVAEGGGPPTVAHDVFTVGRTLAELVDAVAEPPAAGLGPTSLRRLLERATADQPRDRFTSAAEMAGQLDGVLRELAAAGTGHRHPAPSRVFTPTPVLLDDGLGAVPGLAHWQHRERAQYRDPGPVSPVLRHGRPEPFRVAVGLPVPVPHRADPAAAALRTLTPRDARGAVRQLESLLGPAEESGYGSVEVLLHLCRAHLRTGDSLPAGDAARAVERERAAARLARAAEALDARVPGGAAHDWRIAWHTGLCHLAAHDTAAAEREFRRVHAALPGEYAPKLALGYCAEQRDALADSERLYRAVWACDPQPDSAAFGLARIHLARGNRDEAARVLGLVPAMSLHSDAARIAALRIRAARLSPGPEGLPDADSLLTVLRDLPQAAPALDAGAGAGAGDGQEHARLTAELREWALDWLRCVRRDPARAADRERLPELASELFCGRGTGGPGPQEPPTEQALRTALAQSFRDLAPQSTDRALHARLLDLSHAVAPRVWFRNGGPGRAAGRRR
ncbi:serine/threonine-protein kinase [Streptomyces sp. MP131-18]|uniref:serine/threonine-protein kinase n=1 Tax=Streptomyces sp. MP131-18 TaxID=1857892 RepID=UPI00097C596C|nr:serine/threonine-protein kinase [Streptomyces sp. MP131-18]ONK11320.1 Serine/threonine-protein kinase PknG [Streptomyces sp. MP131-18]